MTGQTDPEMNRERGAISNYLLLPVGGRWVRLFLEPPARIAGLLRGVHPLVLLALTFVPHTATFALGRFAFGWGVDDVVFVLLGGPSLELWFRGMVHPEMLFGVHVVMVCSYLSGLPALLEMVRQSRSSTGLAPKQARWSE